MVVAAGALGAAGLGAALLVDPSAEGVSYAPVLHGVELGRKSEVQQGVAANIAKLPRVVR